MFNFGKKILNDSVLSEVVTIVLVFDKVTETMMCILVVI